jgi:DNA (cytosine-5)-methyltransferase 3A
MKEGINVLSLFDGMSCGQIALDRLGIKVDNYFASEIDKYAITVTKANFPNTQHLGDVRDINPEDLPKIDLLIGGSPCQSFSFAGKRKGMSTKCEVEILTLDQYLEMKADGFEFEGQSYLFWEYMRLLRALKPKYFLLENVVMSQHWQKILSKAIGIHPIKINSALVCAQNRNRLYWTNIGAVQDGFFGDMKCGIEQPKDKGILLKDVLEGPVDEKYFLSEKMIKGFERHSEKHQKKGNGFEFNPSSGENKGKCLTARMHKMGIDDNYIVHNTQPRCGDPSKGGTGHLTRNDGKTYCLDTGQSNAVEIRGGDFRYDEGFRWRDGGKSGTLTCGSESGVSGNALANIDTRIRRLTPIECERLQTVPDNYTNHVSDTQRYKMLGNGWTVDVICHIFSYLNFDN